MDRVELPLEVWVPRGSVEGGPVGPFPAFRGGKGGASLVGDVGKSVLVEAKIWLVKAP